MACGLPRRPARLDLGALGHRARRSFSENLLEVLFIGSACAKCHRIKLNFGKFSWCHASRWDGQLLSEQQGDPWSRQSMAIVYGTPVISDADAQDGTMPMRSS